MGLEGAAPDPAPPPPAKAGLSVPAFPPTPGGPQDVPDWPRKSLAVEEKLLLKYSQSSPKRRPGLSAIRKQPDTAACPRDLSGAPFPAGPTGVAHLGSSSRQSPSPGPPALSVSSGVLVSISHEQWSSACCSDLKPSVAEPTVPCHCISYRAWRTPPHALQSGSPKATAASWDTRSPDLPPGEAVLGHWSVGRAGLGQQDTGCAPLR